MRLSPLPCFDHPTTLIAVDDNQDFLDSIAELLADTHAVQTFTSPTKAWSFIQTTYHTPHYFKRVYESLSDTHVTLGLSSIHERIYHPERFQEQAVVILDYRMPEQDGISLAQEIKTATSLQVILLTGEADHRTAIAAFNEHLIDAFLSKHASPQELLRCVRDCETAYFRERSRALMDALQADSTHQHPLRTPAFIALVSLIRERYQVVESYLLDDCGSFLFLDPFGEATWLLVRRENDLQTYYELANSALVDSASETLVTTLKKRQKIPCFSKLGVPMEAFATWRFFDATALEDTGIYYCLKHGEAGYPLRQGAIHAYANYLARHH